VLPRAFTYSARFAFPTSPRSGSPPPTPRPEQLPPVASAPYVSCPRLSGGHDNAVKLFGDARALRQFRAGFNHRSHDGRGITRPAQGGEKQSESKPRKQGRVQSRLGSRRIRRFGLAGRHCLQGLNRAVQGADKVDLWIHGRVPSSEMNRSGRTGRAGPILPGG